jgi:hypothetical protein
MSFWYEVYSKIHPDRDFSHKEFLGLELQRFKELQSRYDNFTILLAIDKGLREGEDSIQYFSINIEKYLPSTNYPKHIFLINKHGNDEEKVKIIDLMVLESNWYPSAHTNIKIKNVINEFEEYLIGKNLWD